MTRYYQDLHDRELISQAEGLLNELHRRRLLDVRVPYDNAAKDQTVRCPVDSVVRSGNVLCVVVDRNFEPTSQILRDAAHAEKEANAAPGS